MRTTISLTFKHTFIYTVTYTCKIDSIHPSLPRSIPLPAPLLAPSHLSFHAGLYIHGPYCFISRLQSIRENLPRAIFFYPVSALRNALRLGTFTARINTMTIITTDLYSSVLFCFMFISLSWSENSSDLLLATIVWSSVCYVIPVVPALPSSRDPFNGSFMGWGKEGAEGPAFLQKLDIKPYSYPELRKKNL